ncbi:hypothetical protein [Paenarthrobacter sp. NPDC091669]
MVTDYHSHSRKQAFDVVAADDERAAQLVVDHLAELGLRHIASSCTQR